MILPPYDQRRQQWRQLHGRHEATWHASWDVSYHRHGWRYYHCSVHGRADDYA